MFAAAVAAAAAAAATAAADLKMSGVRPRDTDATASPRSTPSTLEATNDDE